MIVGAHLAYMRVSVSGGLRAAGTRNFPCKECFLVREILPKMPEEFRFAGIIEQFVCYLMEL